ncbi:MAG TPA: LD-carboxypeptidase [Symbiobacteriaceae bacterium]
MQLIRPPRLQPGDLIGIVSPSSPVAHVVPRRLKRGMAELERLGFRVRLGRHATAKHGHTAGTIADRVADLHEMFADPEVKGIITTIGGYNSNQLLDQLDYDLIAANPKVFMGYSDITALHMGIHVRAGLFTFLGPAVLPQFGEAGGLMPYIRQSFQRTVCTTSPVGELEPSPETVAETLRWDEEDDRPRRTTRNPGPRPLRSGVARGRWWAAFRPRWASPRRTPSKRSC